MAQTAKRYGALVSVVFSSSLLAAPAIAADAEAPQATPSGEATETKPPPEAAAPAVVTPPPAPPPVVEKSASEPKVSAGAWLRIGGRIQNPSNVNRLNDGFMDTLYLVAAFRGHFTSWLKWQASLAATHYTPPTDITLDAELVIPQAGLQDLIFKIEPHPLFNIWVGKMLLPVDRANLSGPWFINYWMIRGAFPRSGATAPAPYGLKSGPFGRDQGVSLWGQVLGGKFKYYVGAYGLDNQSMNATPMVAGRLCLNLLDPEPGYTHQSAYHGDKDILAIGVGGQYQKGASVTVIPAAVPELEVGDLKVVTFDGLFDKKFGSHVVTAEASATLTDKFQPVTRLYLFGLGYTSPPVGPGRLVPAVRLQIAKVPEVMSATNPTGREIGLDREYRQIDGAITYLIKGHNAKIMLGGFWTETRQRSALPTDPSSFAKGIQFGFQIIHM
jgi:hypothetical protein